MLIISVRDNENNRKKRKKKNKNRKTNKSIKEQGRTEARVKRLELNNFVVHLSEVFSN